MILIALGANLPSRVGPPAHTLTAAVAELSQSGTRIVTTSSLYATHAWPDPKDPPFVNAVVRIQTALSPSELLRTLNAVEHSFGRERHTPNAPRTLDLDILDYDGLVQDGPPTLPHPRMHQRNFVLFPLAEVAPDWRHPILRKTARELVALLPKAERLPTKITR